jgi:hypothetical protein
VKVFRGARECSERVGSWRYCGPCCGTVQARRGLRKRTNGCACAVENWRKSGAPLGYRRLPVLLQREGWTVNRQRVYRIYVEEKLMVRRRKRRRRICAQAWVLLAAPMRANETWTMDFLQDALASGRKVRTLSIEDAYTREMLAIEVDTSLPSLRVVRVRRSSGNIAHGRCGSSSTMARNSLRRR